MSARFVCTAPDCNATTKYRSGKTVHELETGHTMRRTRS